ncbi:complement factor H-related protein 1-like isoform 2-T2 [Tautogolabrus adspersus]
MCVRYLAFVILIVLPGALHAQPCGAPGLDGGYLVPKQETYSPEIKITYACDSGRKPAVKGWWATSTCQNGVWSPEPQCINEEDCLPPEIPNAKFNKPSGWYNPGNTIGITCDEGYELKNRDATAVCLNGTWTSVPVCEISSNACGEPPQIPNAVIIGQEYQEVFLADSKVKYECEDGYSAEGAESKTLIICISGNWSEGPTCIRGTRPGSGGGEGHTTSSDRTQPAGGGSRPGTAQGGSAGGGNTPSAGSAARPGAVKNCGTFPTVTNGEVVESTEWFLKYSCIKYYKLEGPETVLCYGDGTWSNSPTCRAAFCAVNTDEHPLLVSIGKVFMNEGEEREFDCVDLREWWFDHYSVAKCTIGGLSLQKCKYIFKAHFICFS